MDLRTELENKIDVFLNKLQGKLSEEDLLTVTNLVLDFESLTARSLAGHDVSDLLEDTKVALAGIEAGFEVSALHEIRAVVIDVVTSFVSKLLK